MQRPPSPRACDIIDGKPKPTVFQLFQPVSAMPAPAGMTASVPFNFQIMKKSPGQLESDSLLQMNLVSEFLNKCGESEFNWTSALPIFATPAHVRSAILASADNDELHLYSASSGTRDLKQAIANYFNRTGIQCTEANILVHIGTFEILKDIYASIEWDNSCILIPTPTFGYYAKQTRDSGIKTVLIHARKENNWKIDPVELDEYLRKHNPRVFLFTNPVNPTGVIYTKDELTAISSILKRHNVLVISDEIFRDLIIDESAKFCSIASIDGMADRCITIHGLGKAMGMAGIRISYACTSPAIINSLPMILCGLSTPSEKAALSALNHTDEMNNYLDASIKEYRKNITFINQQIDALNAFLSNKFGVNNEYVRPLLKDVQATNTYMVSFSGLNGMSFNGKIIRSGLDLAAFLLKHAGVALVPGEGSFISGDEISLRFITSVNTHELSLGFKKITKSLELLSAPLKVVNSKPLDDIVTSLPRLG